MAWTAPLTWTDGLFVLATHFNTYVRDNQNILKTQMDNDGSLRTLLKGFAFSAGQGNVGAGTDELTSYRVTIPASFMSQPGDALLVQGTLSISTTAGTKVFYIQVGGGTLLTVMSTTATAANMIFPFRYIIRRRAATTGELTGFALVGAASAGAPTNYMVDLSLGTVAWGSSQTLSFWASSSGAVNSDVLLTDLFVDNVRGVTGTTV